MKIIEEMHEYAYNYGDDALTEMLNRLEDDQMAILEAAQASKCAACADLGMAALVERLQSEKAALLKQNADMKAQLAEVEVRMAPAEDCASGCSAIRNHLNGLAVAQDQGRLQLALDRIEAAGYKADSNQRLGCYETIVYDASWIEVHVTDGYKTRAEAAEQAAKWATKQRAANSEAK